MLGNLLLKGGFFINKKLKGFLIYMALCVFIVTFLISMAVVVLEPEPLDVQIQRDFELESTEANHLKNILFAVGVTEYESVITYPKNDNKYKVEDKGYVVNVLNAEPIYVNVTDKADFIKVIYKDHVLYEPGMTNGNIYDHILTRDELSNYKMLAEKDVKRILKNPKQASFPLLDGWKYGKIDGEIVLQCYVDAHNSFGAVVRSDFQVKYKSGALVSLIFDGKEYVKY